MLRKKLHQVHDYNGKSGNGRVDWPYYDVCYGIWGTSHSANPVALLSSMDSEEVSAELASSEAAASSTTSSSVPAFGTSLETMEEISREIHSESPQPPPAKKAKKRLSRTEIIVKEVKDLFFEMDRDFEERERVRLAEQRQYEERLRREASQAREEEMAKQMSMLRELQETQNRFLGELLCRMPAPAPTHYYVPPYNACFHNLSTSEDTENSTFTPLSSSSFLHLE
ncbi:hypothetical protein Q8A67_000126 [Cirrhinus molitorella]|uniref:Uncharacterized protein n=1 Tax=Cirrhinus molitorella TaxID=172907 RepID=A0AA88QC45_9TELE|nr:hypothetical protein Q8A67_000126 [Cirrhinus molitorella]